MCATCCVDDRCETVCVGDEVVCAIDCGCMTNRVNVTLTFEMNVDSRVHQNTKAFDVDYGYGFDFGCALDDGDEETGSVTWNAIWNPDATSSRLFTPYQI